jgi:hypothetical protein
LSFVFLLIILFNAVVGITKIKYSIFLLVLINNYWFYFRYSMLCGSFRKNEQILTDPVTAKI